MIILFNFFFTSQTNETFGLYDDDVEDDDNALFLKVLMRGNPHTCLYFMFIFFFIISYIYILWLYTSISFLAKGEYLYPWLIFQCFCHCYTGIISFLTAFIASIFNNVINYYVRWTYRYSTYCCFGAI